MAETAEVAMDGHDILEMRELAAQVAVMDEVLDYAVRLVSGTHPEIDGASDTAKKYIKYGASPRAAQALITCAKVRALMNGNFNVSYADVEALALPVLRHRIKINYTAINDKLTVDGVIAKLIGEIKK
jgi:MoxR-like ATPase